MNEQALCKGSWYLGTACGSCLKCARKSRDLIPALLEKNKRQREILEGISEELSEHGKLVSNPKLTRAGIDAILKAA